MTIKGPEIRAFFVSFFGKNKQNCSINRKWWYNYSIETSKTGDKKMELYVFDECTKKVIFIIRGEEAAVYELARDYYEQQGLVNCHPSAAFGLDASGAEVIDL